MEYDFKASDKNLLLNFLSHDSWHQKTTSSTL